MFEEADLAAGDADAAFVWGPSAGYINHATLQDRFKLVAVHTPQMQFPAAIGLAGKQTALRDEIDAVLPALGQRIQALSAKYAVESSSLTGAAPVRPVAADATAAAPAQAATANRGEPAKGKEIFNGTCAHCHGPNAVVEDRKINLRRLQIKYADQMEEIYFAAVTNGRPTKGMPSWKEVFKPQDFVDILAYLKTLQEK